MLLGGWCALVEAGLDSITTTIASASAANHMSPLKRTCTECQLTRNSGLTDKSYPISFPVNPGEMVRPTTCKSFGQSSRCGLETGQNPLLVETGRRGPGGECR